MEAYRIEHLTFTYPNRAQAALSDISLSIEQGTFLTLCGASGCGKTTLLRQLKPEIAPHGMKSGKIFFENKAIAQVDARETAAKIGFVLQSPDNQIVTDKVWHELAFGLESLGRNTAEIRLRVAEMASFFGIQSWFHKSVTELSGGQKQILALASIMTLQPSVLILDEPTSQLDPIAAGEFLAILGKINRELGVTVILTEHRLEEALPLSNRVLVLDKGQVIADGTPCEVGLQLRGENHGMFLAMPVPMRVWAACTGKGNPPITVRDGAKWLSEQTVGYDRIAVPSSPAIETGDAAIQVQNVWFRYEKSLPDVLKDLSFTAHYGEITAILGGNGTGKTTTLSLIAGLNTPYRGECHADTAVYMLPQNPQLLFVAKTLREDLLEVLFEHKFSKAEQKKRLAVMVKMCRLEGLLDSHPYDLSGGEQQRAALAKVLLLQPKILLLDEPTKGLDAEYKQILATILRKLAATGLALVMVSHDVEFCAEYADRCALFFDGSIVTEGTPGAFFGGNSFYTTSANRMARHVLPEAVLASDIIRGLGGQQYPAPEVCGIDFEPGWEADDPILSPKAPKLTARRKLIVLILAFCLLATFIFAGLHFDGLQTFIGGGSAAVLAAETATRYIGIMLAIAVWTLGLTLSLTWKREKPSALPQISRQRHKLQKRTIAAAAVILVTIPLTIYIGLYLFGDRRFYFTSLLIILQAMLPFALVFESRKPQARELVMIGVLCAIAVSGRTAFFMLPQFKPVIALVIIAGVAFGGEVGFLVGAMTGLVSNMFFGQGPWTPWQMFAFGIIGFLAGILFRKGVLSRSSVPLAVFGGFATFFIYGGIMNPASVLMFQPSPRPEMFLMAYLQGIPFDLIHATATVSFLLIITQPMLEKLDRIKLKYGLVECKTECGDISSS